MERKLGTLSYNPKNLKPMYHGTGPNRFWDFMQSKVRQNIVEACYNDCLTPEGISLETGIPLPYLDSEISALVEREILIKEGGHYKANVIILTAECLDKTVQNTAPYHRKIADLVTEFLNTSLPAFRNLGFAGSDFSENTLRWQLVTFFLRECAIADMRDEEPPLTAWGDRAYLWLIEEGNILNSAPFNFCTVNSRRGDLIHFIDYLPAPKCDHHDFYGNDHAIEILSDVAHGNCGSFSEYDLETVAELIKKGYIRKSQDTYAVTMPLFTPDQYFSTCKLVKEFAAEKLNTIIAEINRLSAEIISEYTPAHLQSQIPGIANTSKLVNAGCIPLSILIEKNILNTHWNPAEMPTMQIRLHD